MRESHHLLGSHFANIINGFIRRGIAHRLRGQPVLAVPAVEVATEHSKCQCITSRHHMEEWFLLDRVTLQRGDISPWHAQFPTFIEAHLTNPALPLADLAAMSACIAFDCIVIEFFIEVPGYC